MATPNSDGRRRLGLGALAAVLVVGMGASAGAQEPRVPSGPASAPLFEASEPDGLGEPKADHDALQALMAEAASGVGDPHLPFILARLKKALADQDLIGFLDLVDPAYFSEQFALVAQPGRSPGDALGQFACEFFSICDISKTYGFNDIVSMDVLGVSRGFAAGGLVEVRIELRMWDGISLATVIFYDPDSARLASAVG